MKKTDIDEKLRTAVSHAVPDVLDSVLSECDERKGKVISMSEVKRKNGRRGLTSAIAAIAALVLIAGGLTGYGQYRAVNAVDSVISLDVNPSIELEVNKNERILSVNALNDDARVIMGDMDLKGTDLDVAVNALIGSMLQNGYLSELQNSILITVDNADAVKGEELQRRVSEAISGILGGSSVEGAVLGVVATGDSELKSLAAQYGITEGKAALVRGIAAQDDLHSFEELAKLSINELNLLAASRETQLTDVNATGAASEKAYIGDAAALSAAVSHAQADAASITVSRAHIEYDDGRMIYDVEFIYDGREYDYDLDALTGEILEWDSDPVRSAAPVNTPAPADTPAPGQTPAATPQPAQQTTHIGADSAKEKALTDSGIAVDTVRGRVEVELEFSGGQAYYDVEFEDGANEYDYRINADTGEVIYAVSEPEDDHDDDDDDYDDDHDDDDYDDD